MYQSDTAPWLEFYAWNTDGSAKTDLVFNTSGISVVVVRDNQANSSALTLSAASGPTDWAAGKFHAMGGNKYRVGIATASISSFTGQISVEGTYTGGVLTGVTREVSAYNPAGNPNTTTPPTAAANASAVRTELATELARVDAAISTRSTFAGGAVASVTAGVTVTTNNDKTGYTVSTVSDKTGYSLTAGTGLGNQTSNITGNLSGSVGSVTGAVGSVTSGVTVTTNNDKTGYSLASGGLAAVTTWTVGITGNITGNLSGSVGSVTAGVTLDSASIDAIWNEVLTGATHNIAASAGRRLRQLADTVVLVDGECDAASNAGTDSTGTITLEVGTTTACVGQAIRCANQVRYIASYNAGTRVAQLDRPWCVVPDAGDEYVIFNVRNPLVGLASLALAGSTAAAVNDVNAVTEKVDTGLVVDGAVYQFTANMLELGPAGGAATVAVLPATGIVADRSAGTTLNPVVGETISQSITVYQSDGTTAVSLSGKTLKVIFETMSGVDVAVVLAADITISGASSNVVTFAYPSAVTASERTLRFAIRDAAAPLTMYLQGVCSVVAAPKVDA